MIAAFELHDLVVTGNRTHQPHRIHVGLAAGADKTHLFGAGERATNLFGQFNAPGVVGEEGGALTNLLAHGLDDLRMRVAEDHRARPHQVVDVLVAIFVPYPRAVALANNDRRIEIAEPAGRQNVVRARNEVVLAHAFI